MNIVRAIILLLTGSVGTLFWIQNRDVLSEYAHLTLNLAFVRFEFIPLRMDAVIGLAFLVGFVVSYWLSLVPRMRAHFRLRKLQKIVDAGGGTPDGTPAKTAV